MFDSVAKRPIVLENVKRDYMVKKAASVSLGI